MRMKKMFAGIMAAAVATTMAATMAVTAADTIGVSISKTEAAAGEDFTLTVDLKDVPSAGLNGADFCITYDSSVVTVTDVTKGSIVKEVPAEEAAVAEPLAVNTSTKGEISVIYAVSTEDSGSYVTSDGTFLNISGTVSSKAKAGDKSVFKITPIAGERNESSTYFGFINGSNEVTLYSTKFTDGLVTVIGDDEPSTEESTEPSKKPTPSETQDLGEATLYGDVDMNKKIEAADVVLLNKYLLDADSVEPSSISLANADVEKDGEVNTLDSSKLVNFIAKLVAQTALGK